MKEKGKKSMVVWNRKTEAMTDAGRPDKLGQNYLVQATDSHNHFDVREMLQNFGDSFDSR